MTYLIKYLGEFEFIFETVLGCVSGEQLGYLKEKKRSRKSHAWAPLNFPAKRSSASRASHLNVINRNVIARAK